MTPFITGLALGVFLAGMLAWIWARKIRQELATMRTMRTCSPEVQQQMQGHLDRIMECQNAIAVIKARVGNNRMLLGRKSVEFAALARSVDVAFAQVQELHKATTGQFPSEQVLQMGRCMQLMVDNAEYVDRMAQQSSSSN